LLLARFPSSVAKADKALRKKFFDPTWIGKSVPASIICGFFAIITGHGYQDSAWRNRQSAEACLPYFLLAF